MTLALQKKKQSTKPLARVTCLYLQKHFTDREDTERSLDR